MLVTDGDRCLLGRYKASPPGMWTCLAGFVEQAERLETAVAREVLEESGVEADEDSVEIVGSQAWPCGRGGSCELMLGCAVRAKAGTPAELGPDLQLDDNMAGVRWASRAEARGMVEASMDARAAAAVGDCAHAHPEVGRGRSGWRRQSGAVTLWERCGATRRE